MIITGPATEAEAVLAFLQAEIDSPRHHFRASLPAAIAAYIDTPVLGDAAQDAERLSILQQVRGFGANKLLFQGWPPSVTWYHQQFTLAEVAQLLYAKHPTWQNLTTGSRRVADGVAGLVLDHQVATHVQGIAVRLAAGETFPPLLMASDGSQTVIFEGHSRATSYVLLGQPQSVEAITAVSPLMSQWVFF